MFREDIRLEFDDIEELIVTGMIASQSSKGYGTEHGIDREILND